MVQFTLFEFRWKFEEKAFTFVIRSLEMTLALWALQYSRLVELAHSCKKRNPHDY